MSDLVDQIIKYIPIIGIVFVSIRLFMKITNKNTIDVLLTPKNDKSWEDFLELFFLTVILTILLSGLSFIFANKLLDTYFNSAYFIVFTISWSTFLLIIILNIISFFTVLKKIIKFIKAIIFTNFAVVLIFSSFVTAVFKNNFINLLNNKQNSIILIFFGSAFIFYFMLFYLYRTLYQHLIKPKKPSYRIEKIPVTSIEEELKYLYLIYMIDSERHVLCNHPTKRKAISLPAYVYYPKENSLIKYSTFE